MKIDTIKENPNNPRIIKDAKFKKLVESIKQFPQMMKLRPIIIDEKNIILGGNMRFKAIKEIGLKEIPDEWVKKAEELTEQQKQEFIIKDNVGFGEWDFEKLDEQWDNDLLNEWGIELTSLDEEIPEFDEDENKASGNVIVCPKCGFEWQS